ncbi:C40 family peptidase [Uliginosibacterium sp. H3]|uniref:C40 family peptidase n=1 Tax=Uliginosibacterium silvisoli TaxID=3114758 RepID=A0ABU6K451_9RHOO|nr:C40 family peptidase [Uliginosibacterium sp. H3]
MLRKTLLLVCLCSLSVGAFAADEPAVQPQQPSKMQRYALGAQEVFSATKSGIESLYDKSFSFLGIRYVHGGDGPSDGGFDCSGLVKKVFGDALGLNLPRTAAEMSKLGNRVNKEELKPGDLVFFNTMRRAFSHVGIYLGENRFVHAPSTGGVVRVESMDSSYWVKRFNGGRRLAPEAQAAALPPAEITADIKP